MLLRLTEDIAEGMFLLKGYITLRNVMIRAEKYGWTDIDVLAFNEKEIYIVQCKRGSLNKEQALKVVRWFKNAERRLRNEKPYSYLIEKMNLKIKKLYIAKYIRNEKNLLLENNIEVKKADEILKEVIKLIKQRLKEEFEGAEPNYTLRLLTLLIQEEFIRVTNNQNRDFLLQ